MPETRNQPVDLTYRVHPVDPEAHLFEVELLLSRAAPAMLRLSLPAWIPGSYMIRDFARNLVEIAASDGEGAPLALEKHDKQTWVADRPVATARVRYRVHAWDRSVRGCHLDATHAYFNGPGLLLRVDGADERPCALELLPPPGEGRADWRLACACRPESVDARGFGRYLADDYADLIDHPVEMGRFTEIPFDVDGVPHRMVLSGQHRADGERLVEDLEHICREHAALFGELPLDRYLFLTSVTGAGYGGLEHRFSTSLMCARADLPRRAERDRPPREGYVRFLGLCSHEYFHLWNVKRIRPQALIDGGLEHEVHTRLLWAFEGITSYYDELALVRSGRIDTATYLGLLANAITRLQRNPGRHLQTLAGSSFDAWTRFYKQDESAPNVIVSYYLKGALVALALDLTLRQRSAGACSLDTVMRALWTRHGRTGVGVAERGIEALAEEVSGLELGDFFATALDSTDELDLAPLFASLGIEMRLRPARDGKDLGGCVERFDPVEAPATLGVRLAPGAPEGVVRHVLAGSPGERAGLAPGDRLVALDGLRVGADDFERAVAALGALDAPVSLHVFRDDELLELAVRPQPAPADTCELRLLPEADAAAQAARAAWLASHV
ncbi:M61 family metallopeptidase [Marichromatium sp. AB31]|uniref:M61 family metallopeptidase n=1 Tax=Marichromatium sp. AB31 TaxID=2483362 RepID=UPI000F3B79D2|nr:PDZ domain-containing protein [Marichromatium sp. AB31]MBO8084460.1 M61 family metallopeptidase [Marichromatium sp.]RNE90803.1 M61 family peptidase [Marichromatium sp. AB31]